MQRILELEVGGYEVVARAGYLAFPSRVALDAYWLQHSERVGQVAEAFLKKQIAAHAGMRFRTDIAVADGQFEARADREHEFVTRNRDEYALVGKAEVGKSARAGFLAFLLEALVADEQREAGLGRDGFFEIQRLEVLGAIDAARQREIILDRRVIADEVTDE